MTLIERLRQAAPIADYPEDTEAINEAADRIERLEVALRTIVVLGPMGYAVQAHAIAKHALEEQ